MRSLRRRTGRGPAPRRHGRAGTRAPSSTGWSCRRDPAIPLDSAGRLRWRGRRSTTDDRCSGSVSGTRSWAARPVPRRGSSRSGTTAPTIRCATSDIDAQVTAQNHEVQVVGETLPARSLPRRQVNLNDGSVEGLRHAERPIETVQYHPEGAPGRSTRWPSSAASWRPPQPGGEEGLARHEAIPSGSGGNAARWCGTGTCRNHGPESGPVSYYPGWCTGRRAAPRTTPTGMWQGFGLSRRAPPSGVVSGESRGGRRTPDGRAADGRCADARKPTRATPTHAQGRHDSRDGPDSTATAWTLATPATAR